MKNIKFEKIIPLILAAVLVLTGSFLWLSKTVHATDVTVKTDDGKIVYTFGDTFDSITTSEDGKTVILYKNGEKEGEDAVNSFYESLPRVCGICKVNACMPGQLYCEDCYNKILNGASVQELMAKANKETAQSQTNTQAAESARENSNKSAGNTGFIIVMVLIFAVIFCILVVAAFRYSNTSLDSLLHFRTYKGSTPTFTPLEDDYKNISLVNESMQPAKPKKEKISASNEAVKTENTQVDTKKELGKKDFLDCLKQQTTSFRSGDSFAVCTGDNDELVLMHYYSNSFNTVKVMVDDNGKLKVVYDFRRKHDFMVAIDYESDNNSLRFDLKSSKGNKASFVLKPVVNTKINGYEINYDQTGDYTLISSAYLPNYINWIQQNAELEQLKTKELTNQELREKVKKLDPEVRNQFMELAKNGKTNEAIKVCNDVTGFGLKDAKRVIEYKLYY